MRPPLVLTPGPVRLSDRLKQISTRDLPYNRTADFSELTLKIINRLKFLVQTEGDVVIFTSSGTGAMEASVLNFLNKQDRVLILNGGTFGERWKELCVRHGIAHVEYQIDFGGTPDLNRIESLLLEHRITAFLINAHETSTGALYPMRELGQIMQRHGVFFMVDAIGTLCCDPYFMDEWHVDVSIFSSQKGLGLPPGLAFLALNDRARQRLNPTPATFYFDIPEYLKNQKRGQMPFTPAIGLYLLLAERLNEIHQSGLELEIAKHATRAQNFRTQVTNLPFDFFPHTPSNAITALQCHNGIIAKTLVQKLQTDYQIYLAPNGGDLGNRVFRVSHMGEQNESDIFQAVQALKDLTSST